MYKMVLKIKKESWEKCGIKTVKYYSEKEYIIELWQKMSDVKTQTKHTNIDDIKLMRIRKYCGKKKRHHKKRKRKLQSIF